MDKQATREIIAQVKAGNKEAFSVLYRMYYPKIYSFLCRTFKDDILAEEITQEVFFRLWVNRKSLDASMSFESYFYTIARNLAFNFVKNKKTEYKYKNRNVDDIDHSGNPENDLNFTELQQLITNAIKAMPPQQQLVFKLSRTDGLLNAEIAEKLGISKRTVEKHISNSLSTLRKLINKNYLLFFY